MRRMRSRSACGKEVADFSKQLQHRRHLHVLGKVRGGERSCSFATCVSGKGATPGAASTDGPHGQVIDLIAVS